MRYAKKEGSISKGIADYLTMTGIYNDRLNSGMVFAASAKGERYPVQLCRKGTPDRFAIYRGQIIFIEVKQPKKNATEDQLLRHAELRKSGAIVVIATSIDGFIAEFKAIKQAIDKRQAVNAIETEQMTQNAG